VFNFNIEYCKRKLNFADILLRRSNIIKFDNSKNNNNNFLSILRNKFCNPKYQSKLQKNRDVSTIVKFAALIIQLNNTTIADIRIINLNKKVFKKLRNILDFALFRLLMQQIAESKKFFANLKELITV